MGRKAGEKVGLLACHGMGGNQVDTCVLHMSVNHTELNTL